MSLNIEMQIFSSKVKYKRIIFIPILVLLMALLIPPIHWSLAIFTSLLFLIYRLWSLRKIVIDETEIRVEYPYRVASKGFSTALEGVVKMVYVDRKGATKGTYPYSHINIYFKDRKIPKQINVILDSSEISEFKYVLEGKGIVFDYTTKMEVHEL